MSESRSPSDMSIQILSAALSDAQEILTLQKLAYQIEAEIYNDHKITPLTQTLDELEEQFTDHTILKAVSEGRIVGTVRAYEKGGTCYIGRLAVDPLLHNKGIGTALMNNIEVSFKPDRYELFTGTKSAKNIHLYQKLGYSIFKTETYGCSDIEICYMRKSPLSISSM